jgi:hypothetical protein
VTILWVKTKNQLAEIFSAPVQNRIFLDFVKYMATIKVKVKQQIFPGSRYIFSNFTVYT